MDMIEKRASEVSASLEWENYSRATRVKRALQSALFIEAKITQTSRVGLLEFNLRVESTLADKT